MCGGDVTVTPQLQYKLKSDQQIQFECGEDNSTIEDWSKNDLDVSDDVWPVPKAGIS